MTQPRPPARYPRGMRTPPRRLALVLAALACGYALPGLAQTTDTPGPSDGPGMGGHAHHGRRGRGDGAQPGHAKPADMKIPPEMWPRLDRGALLCASLDGLRARAAALRDAVGPQPLPPGCRPIGQATKVTVLDRVPPGAAEVSIDATREQGWTDAWLPDKPTGPSPR